MLCSQGIVRTLRQSDSQLFSGWAHHPAVNDDSVLSTLDRLADKAAQLLKVVLLLNITSSNTLSCRKTKTLERTMCLCSQDVVQVVVL